MSVQMCLNELAGEMNLTAAVYRLSSIVNALEDQSELNFSQVCEDHDVVHSCGSVFDHGIHALKFALKWYIHTLSKY